jgi:DNA recombination protein RmuC
VTDLIMPAVTLQASATWPLIVGGALALALFAVAWQVWQLRGTLSSGEEVDTEALTNAMHAGLRDVGLDESVTAIEHQAREIRETHADIESIHRDVEGMLRDPRQRGAFGEHQLDVILGNHLPPEMYGVREQVVGSKTPDAHIETSAGLIPIDAKFPLENYERAATAEDETTAEYEREFASDVESQLEKIATDYVRPAEGTTPFAFAFIPSEAVYYHLVTEEYDMLQEYATRGVQVVSPLTLGQKLELVKADVQAQRLSAEAAAIADALDRLGERFAGLEEEWETLRGHVRNAHNRAEDVDGAFRSLQDAFERIEDPDLVAATETEGADPSESVEADRS